MVPLLHSDYSGCRGASKLQQTLCQGCPERATNLKLQTAGTLRDELVAHLLALPAG